MSRLTTRCSEQPMWVKTNGFNRFVNSAAMFGVEFFAECWVCRLEILTDPYRSSGRQTT